MIETIMEYNRVFYAMHFDVSDEDMVHISDSDVNKFIDDLLGFNIGHGCPVMSVRDCSAIFGDSVIPRYKNGELCLDGNCLHKKAYDEDLLPEEIKDKFMIMVRDNCCHLADCEVCWAYNYYVGLKYVLERSHFWKAF